MRGDIIKPYFTVKLEPRSADFILDASEFRPDIASIIETGKAFRFAGSAASFTEREDRSDDNSYGRCSLGVLGEAGVFNAGRLRLGPWQSLCQELPTSLTTAH